MVILSGKTKKPIPLGILQGRLSPSLDGRLQFFPDDWPAEFAMATKLGFSALEWLVDWREVESNPILAKAERKKITAMQTATGCVVSSICADYFMKFRLIGDDTLTSLSMLERLAQATTVTSNRLILIPLLEGNAPRNEEELALVSKTFQQIMPLMEEYHVRIALETELGAQKILDLLESVGSPMLGVYYDIGNCTSYGFDCPADILSLGEKVFGVHIKDRKKMSTNTVFLGTGDAKLMACAKALKTIGFQGIPILQAWRGELFLDDAKKQLEALRSQGW